MQNIFIFIFFLLSISTLSAKNYECDLKFSNPKIKWDQIDNQKYIEVPFTRPGSVGSYIISINNDIIQINSFKFEENFYESQKKWSDNYIENFINEVLYEERLSKNNKTYIAMFIKWMKKNNYNLREIDGFEKFNGTTYSLHKILRTFPESKKKEYRNIVYEFNEAFWQDTSSKSEFIKIQEQLYKPSSFEEFNKLLNYNSLNKSRTNSDLILNANSAGVKMNIKFKNLYSNFSSLSINANFKSTSWVNGFKLDASMKSNCRYVNLSNSDDINFDYTNKKTLDGSVRDKLIELKSMMTEGLISQEQYDEKSSEILDDF